MPPTRERTKMLKESVVKTEKQPLWPSSILEQSQDLDALGIWGFLGFVPNPYSSSLGTRGLYLVLQVCRMWLVLVRYVFLGEDEGWALFLPCLCFFRWLSVTCGQTWLPTKLMPACSGCSFLWGTLAFWLLGTAADIWAAFYLGR